jgi:hypothetical protein
MTPTLAAWITAVATAVLAVGVITLAFLARRQSRHLTALNEFAAQLADVLALQAKSLRQSLADQRRAQACSVFIELDRAAQRVTATVHNASPRPVYDVYVIWQLGTVRMGKPDRAARLMPGQQLCVERAPERSEAGSQAVAGALAAFLTFRDAAGVRWTVREDGTLTDITPALEQP